VSFFGPAFTEAAFVVPADLSEAADLVRPVLIAGDAPTAVIILVEIEAQGAGD